MRDRPGRAGSKRDCISRFEPGGGACGGPSCWRNLSNRILFNPLSPPDIKNPALRGFLCLAEREELSESDTVVESLTLPDPERTAGQDHLLLVESPQKLDSIKIKNAPSTPSNHRQKRRRRQSETLELNQK